METDYPDLVEIDALEIQVIIDNELDPMSPVSPDTVQVTGGSLGHIALTVSPGLQPDERGGAIRELRMEDICCSAHGLSIMITATKGDIKHTVLFDAGPEEEVWRKNATRLKADISQIELIQLSHWHRDHSGGLLEAIRMINKAKHDCGHTGDKVIVDVHPSRPDYRGFQFGEKLISLEADPTIKEIKQNGGQVREHDETHTVLDDMFLISGEIPRRTSYETGLRNGMRFDKADGEWFSDEKVADERFLVCHLKDKGLVVFTGCSHAGVVNVSRHASNLFGGKVAVHAIVGGYHLSLSDHDTVKETVADLKTLDPAILMPGHCTGWRAKFSIEKAMPGSLVPCAVGTRLLFRLGYGWLSSLTSDSLIEPTWKKQTVGKLPVKPADPCNAPPIIRVSLSQYNGRNYNFRLSRRHGGFHAPKLPSGPILPIKDLKFLFSAASAHHNNRLIDFFMDLFQQYGSLACPNCVECNFTGGQRFFLTQEPDHIKAVLTGNFADFGKRKVFHDLWSPFLGDSIFTTDGKSWSDGRQLIRPMFIKDRVSDLDIFERRTQVMMSLFAEPGEAFDIMDLFHRLTLDVTTEFLLGHGVQSLENPRAKFVEAFTDVQRRQMTLTVLQPVHRLIPKGEYYRGIDTINDFVVPFVQEALDLPPEELGKRSRSEKSFTFLHSLASFTRDPKVIRDQIVAVLLAGRDTTAATLSWFMYEISHRPDIVRKLRQEILDIVGPTRPPTYDDLKNMTYLKHAVNETLRLYPAVPFNVRFALSDTALPSGGGANGKLPLPVLKGDGLVYSTYAMQRRKDLYPPISEVFADPAVFSPERWESWRPKPWQYVPFNGGPRICIGQNFALAEISYIISRILQRYARIEYDGRWEDQFYKADVVGTPGMGVQVKLWPADVRAT